VVRTRGDAATAPAGTRVDPGQARTLAQLVASPGSVVRTAPGAHHYRLSGLDIRATEAAFLYTLVQIGSAETAMEDVPHHVIVERCLIRGDPRQGPRRGAAPARAHGAVIHSHRTDRKAGGADPD